MGSMPPPYSPARKGSNAWVWIIVGAVFFCLLLGGFAAFGAFKLIGMGTRVLGCAMTGEMATTAILAYAKDHEGLLPPAATWQDDVKPYYERLYRKAQKELEDMPKAFDIAPSAPGTALTCEWGKVKTGFAYNAKLANKKLEEIEDRSMVILLFETTDPAYNLAGAPEDREGNAAIQAVKDSRGLFDFDATGGSQLTHSSNDGMDIEFDVGDALKDDGEEASKSYPGSGN